MKKPVVLLTFLLSLLSLATALQAQSRGGMLQGTITEEKVTRATVLVRDTTTGKQSEKLAYIYKLVPIKGVKVELKSSGISTVTDTAGKYFIQGIPRGLYDIFYSADGYKSDLFQGVFIKRDTITEIDISLERNESAASEITVNASRFEQKLQSVPVSLSLPNPNFLTRQSPVSIDEGLRYVPGVSFSGQGMSIRASGSTIFSGSCRTVLFLDNQPVMSSALGNIAWDMFPTDFLERAEVIKGGASSLYGSGAVAGVVNLLTPITPARFRSGTTLRTYGGFYIPSSETRLLGGAEASHAETFGDVNIYGSIGRFTDEGYRENSDFKRWRFFSKSVYHLSNQSELSLIASFAEENRGNNLRWRSFDQALLDGNSSLTNFYSGSLLLAPSYKTSLSRVATLLARGRYLRTNLHESNRGYGEDQFGLETQMIIDFGSSYTFTGGLEGNHSNANSTLFGDHQASGFGIYIQSESPLIESVQMTYGVRYDGEWVDDGQYLGEFSPRIGAVFALSETSALYANLSKGFRFASLAERFGSPLTAGLPILPNN
ncbi:MAG: TonB-dependent receptor, partial [Chlorobiales bacterium]|nr:TonB-dependent receptor [Chlorobiales bacterium]